MNIYKHRGSKKFIAFLLCLILTASCCILGAANSQGNTVNAAVNEYGLSTEIKGSNILHAFCWNFNSIKAKLPEIADAGFTAVQTSPINACLVGDGGGLDIMGNGKWYYHYQTTGLTIGNYQLGTKAEFISMCAEAKKYGIKIIVDVVPNHTTPNTGSVDSSLRDLPGGLYHNKGGNINYGSRESVTQHNLIGLPDCNTHNTNYQQAVLNYLKECVAAGASGFRFDAAKHIELPTDDAGFKSDFWPVILNNGSEFQYGEVLQDPSNSHTVKMADYASLMGVTASSWGYVLREEIEKDQLSASRLNSFYADGTTPSSQLVTWVESHDTYCNNNESAKISNTKIRLAWAVLAARKDGTGLFFSRPMNSSTSNYWGNNKIGPAGDDNFKHPEVKAVNKFKNLMQGQPETLSNPNSNAKIIMIQRGSAGLVLSNANTSTTNISVNVSLPNGSYEDRAHPGTYYTVSDGKLNGNIPAQSVVVLYDGSDLPTVPTTSYVSQPTTSAPIITTVPPVYPTAPISPGQTVVFFDNSQTNWDEVYLYYYRDGGEYRNWPGEAMISLGNNLYYYVIDSGWDNANVLVNNNNNGQQFPGQGVPGPQINKGEQKLLTGSGELVDYQLPTEPPTTIPPTTTIIPTTTLPVTTTTTFISTTTAPVITTTTPATTASSAPTTTTPDTTTSDNFIWGDVDISGELTIGDCTLLQKYLAFIEPLSDEQLNNADIFRTGTSTISITNVTTMQKVLAKLIII